METEAWSTETSSTRIALRVAAETWSPPYRGPDGWVEIEPEIVALRDREDTRRSVWWRWSALASEAHGPLVRAVALGARSVGRALGEPEDDHRAETRAWGMVALVCAATVRLFAYLVFCSPGCRRPWEAQARTDAMIVQSATILYLSTEPGAECPTVEDLVASGQLHRSARTIDPWGRPYTIRCDGYDVWVRSAGRDGRKDTADDVVPGQ